MLLYVRMAAMHWEARRRQSLLDRRTARDKQQVSKMLCYIRLMSPSVF